MAWRFGSSAELGGVEQAGGEGHLKEFTLEGIRSGVFFKTVLAAEWRGEGIEKLKSPCWGS